jgi:hypothetical protein
MSTPGDNSKQPGRRFVPRLSSIRSGVKRACGNELPPWQVWALRLTLVVDGVVALALAFLEFELVATMMAALGASFFLAIGAANLWALYSLVRALRSWPRDVAIAQLLIVLLAIYIGLTAVRSYGQNWWTLGITAAVGVLAIGWILRVLRGAVSVHWTRPAAIIAALIPLAGLVQFWLQTEYIPNMTTPLFDVTADLSPTGTSGSKVHLSAKVTYHNRGSVILIVPAGLMRVTAYPRTPQLSDTPCSTVTPPRVYDGEGNVAVPYPSLMNAMDPTNSETDAEFRLDKTPVAECVLLYAAFMGGPDAFINPGATLTVQKDIDINADAFRLARLSVSAVLVTKRRFNDVRACWPTKDTPESVNPHHWPVKASLYSKPPDDFYTEAQHLWPDPRYGTQNLCVDYELAPRSIVQQLVSDPTVLRVQIVTGRQGDSVNEYPQINFWHGTAADIDASPSVDEREKMLQANPTGGIADVTAEYAPCDAASYGCRDSAPASGH